jgi:hypothetical protein
VFNDYSHFDEFFDFSENLVSVDFQDIKARPQLF